MTPPSQAHLSLIDGDAPGDIDARIMLVEQRLIERETRLRGRVTSLGERLGDSFKPKRLLLPAVGVAAALLGLFSMRRHRAYPPESRPAAGATALGKLPWVHLLTLAWPLVPQRWRSKVSPAAATGFATLGLPLLEHLLAARRPATPLQAVDAVDLARLGGRWFLIGELPAPVEADPLEPPEVGLLARDDGHFDLLQRRIDSRGTQGRQAIVQAVPGSQGARLRMTHWPAVLHSLPWVWSELAVLHVAPGYDEALIGSPSRELLWLWSRQPSLAPERQQALLQMARERGYAVERLRLRERP